MPLRRITFSALIALLAAGVTAGTFRHIQQKKAGEAAYLRYENNQLRFQAYLNQQRQLTQPDRATPRTPDIPSTAKPGTEASAPAAPESYRNQGHATPAAALQTLAWACDRSDTQSVAQMLQFDPGARAKAEAYYNNLPEPERARWQTLDSMVYFDRYIR